MNGPTALKSGYTPDNFWWVDVFSLPFQFLFLVLGIEYHVHFYFSDSDNDTCLDVLLSYPCQASVMILFFLYSWTKKAVRFSRGDQKQLHSTCACRLLDNWN